MASPTDTKREAAQVVSQTTITGVTFTFPAYKPAGASKGSSSDGNRTAIIASVAGAGGLVAALLTAVVYTYIRRRRRRASSAERLDQWISSKGAFSPYGQAKGAPYSPGKGHLAGSSISKPIPQQAQVVNDGYSYMAQANAFGPAPTQANIVTRQALPPLDTVNLNPPAPAYSRHASPIDSANAAPHASTRAPSPSPDTASVVTSGVSPSSTMLGPFRYDNSHYYTPAEAAQMRRLDTPGPLPAQRLAFREVQPATGTRRNSMSSLRRAASSLSRALASRKSPQRRQHPQALAMQQRIEGGGGMAMRISLHPSPSTPTDGEPSYVQAPVADQGGTMVSEGESTGMSFKVPNWQYAHMPIDAAERARMAAIPSL